MAELSASDRRVKTATRFGVSVRVSPTGGGNSELIDKQNLACWQRIARRGLLL